MKKSNFGSTKSFFKCISTLALALITILSTSVVVKADETDAKRILKAMSDYMAAQQAISFGFDATLEIVTDDSQILGLASSGSIIINRPNKLRVMRTGGFSDVEISFNGETLTLLGKNLNLYAQIAVPGSINHLVDELHNTYSRPLPAADLLLSDPYENLMYGVVDIKDLGSGVIDGVECDHLAFRTQDVDWQIWIAQGEKPYPCRYVITSKQINNGPQYTVQIRDWKTGEQVDAADFSFKNSTNAQKVDLKELKNLDELPDHIKKGEDK